MKQTKSEINPAKVVEPANAASVSAANVQKEFESALGKEMIRQYLESLRDPNSERKFPPLMTAVVTEKDMIGITDMVREHNMQVSENVSPGRQTFSVRETAALLNMSIKSVRRLIDRGLLKSSRAIRHHRIPRSEIIRFLDQIN